MQLARASFLSLFASVLAGLPAQEVRRDYAIRIDGRVVGHLTETEEAAVVEGREVLRVHAKTLIKVEILGSHIDQLSDQKWLVARDTREPLEVHAIAKTGPQKQEVKATRGESGWEFADGRATLAADVVFAPGFRWLRSRGAKEGGEPMAVQMFIPELDNVQPVEVSLAENPDRMLKVMGEEVPVRVYLMAMPALAVQSLIFVHRDSYELVRHEMPAQMFVMERCPAAVIERIQRVDLTGNILAKTNLNVDDPSRLTMLRLHAEIEATKDITPESLNVPGQTFAGTVEDGFIVGEFTIHSHRCDPAKSPPFPVPEGAFASPALRAYLEPSENIESDDPALSKKARELAEGASSCYEVMERMATWAYDEIPYVIPGGGTAKRTFALREGECAGHSRVLTAMLRSVGIPARTPMGGMYVPLYGGSFGQHMWTEVWLGDEIGWLPVDCTAGQPTFLDAGHIRLSDQLTVFKPKKIRVHDHSPKAEPVATEPRRVDAYPFAVDEPMVFSWTVRGTDLGEETITYRGNKDGAHVFEGVLDLQSGSFVEATNTRVGDDGRLVAFHCDRKLGPSSSTVDVSVVDGEATIRQKSDEDDKSDTMGIDASTFMMHNNCTTHVLVAVSRVGSFEEGSTHKLRFLHDESKATLVMSLQAKGVEEVEVGAKKVKARAVEATLAGMTILLHVDEQGRVLRYHQTRGDVIIVRSDL
jgi:transglutaminase-like putative cysteine protease